MAKNEREKERKRKFCCWKFGIEREENKNNIEKSMAIWDDIYDWADGNIIQITSKEEEIKSDF